MATVFLKTFQPESPEGNPWLRGPYQMFALSASLGGTGKHQRVTEAAEADVILFCDPDDGLYFSTIIRDELFKKFPEKCFVYVSADKPKPLALLPGVYTSIEQRWHDPRWTRSGFYVHINDRARFDYQPFKINAKWLFSFAGSCDTSPIRQTLLNLHHPRFQMIDTTGKVRPAYISGDEVKIHDLNDTYRQLVSDSKFVLCPRGLGCSSLRLFEVMCMGRAPVIISDEWVAPDGPQWVDFSIRIPEAQILKIPEILEKHEERAAAMGALARQEWERWFSEKMLLETITDWCLQIRAAGLTGNSWYRRKKYFQILRPFHFKQFIKEQKKRVKALLTPPV